MGHSRSTGQAFNPAHSPERSRSEVKQRLLLTLIQRYPLLFWSGIWVIVISIIGLGVTALIHIDPLEAEKPQPEVTIAAQSRLPAKPASSFGLLAAIAVSCGATSFLLAKQFNAPKPQRRVVAKTKSRQAIVNYAANKLAPSARSSAAPAQRATASQTAIAPVASSRLVTVVPPEETHPLDWGDASLADRMDIRKQRSLSSLK